jgi:50S ribosomal subunit-associated GTPase HflX
MANQDLKDKDISILERNIDQKWVPKEPSDLVIPYIDETKKELSALDKKQDKAIYVYNKYKEIETEARELCDTIEEECKNVKVSLDPKKELSVMEAIRRVFGTEGDTVTFEMYKVAVQKLTELNNKTLLVPQK